MRDRIINNDGGTRKLVLATDDAPEILFLLGASLKVGGYHFMGTASGTELLALSLRVVPRLILLDVEMPGMDGFETCRRLRANTDLTRVPIAFLTARKTFEDVTEGLGAGGNDFILKPFVPSQLLERVHHWTSRQIGG
jgi:DNA-binding response OmpR family regulator